MKKKKQQQQHRRKQKNTLCKIFAHISEFEWVLWVALSKWENVCKTQKENNI